MDNKEKIIELFLETIEQNEWFKKYISVEDAKRILNENVKEVVENAKMPMGTASACYNIVDRTVCFPEKFDLQNISNDAKTIIVHELLHALTLNSELDDKDVGEVFSGINYTKTFETVRWGRRNIEVSDDKGRGLNEGITEWLAERLMGGNTYKSELGVYEVCGINTSESNAYPAHQVLVKELAILYGEDVIIQAYLTNNINLIKEAMANNPKIYNASKTFDDFSDLSDSLVEMDMAIGKNFVKKQFRKELRETFSETQDFFVEEILTKEIEVALESQDIVKIEEVKGKLEKLLELNINIKGKGSPFNDIAKKFNEQVASMGIESHISVKDETIIDKLKKTFSKSEMAHLGLYILEPYCNIRESIESYQRQKAIKTLESLNKSMETVTKAVELRCAELKAENSLSDEIRGVPQDEYAKACENAEKLWNERNKSQERDERSAEIELF